MNLIKNNKSHQLLSVDQSKVNRSVWAPSAVAIVLSVMFVTLCQNPIAYAATNSNVILYGAAGTFGYLGNVYPLPTGQSLQTDAVTNWGFAPGESAFFAGPSPTGEIVMATTPLTDNEKYETSNRMEFGVFSPTTNAFRNLVIPTSTGSQTTTNPFSPIGGASIESVTPITVGGVPRLSFTSMVPYNGWNISKYGEYPSFGYLDATTGSLAYNSSMSVTADQIYNYGGLSTNACPQANNLFGQPVASCRGLGQTAVLPLSNKIVATQYFQDAIHGQDNGRIVVLNTNGSVSASYTYPNIPNPSGGYYVVNPREVDVDPTSGGNIEYFTVVFDVVAGGTQGTSPIQEFSYNDTTNQITPVSLPIISGQKASNGAYYRFETAQYDYEGNLWVAQSVTGSLSAGPIVVYSNNSGVRSFESTCAAPGGWSGAGWEAVCTPNYTAVNTSAYGQTHSLNEDPTTHMMFAATLSGYLMRVQQSGSGNGLTLNTMPVINFSLNALTNRSIHDIGVRQGFIDNTNRALWIPVDQVYNATDCPTWPSTKPCAPIVRNQWLYRFDLSALSS